MSGTKLDDHEHRFYWEDKTAYDRCVTCQKIRKRCYHCRKELGVFDTPYVQPVYCSDKCQKAEERMLRPTVWRAVSDEKLPLLTPDTPRPLKPGRYRLPSGRTVTVLTEQEWRARRAPKGGEGEG